jgi:fructosamine-3-kinase
VTESDTLRPDLCRTLGIDPARASLTRIGGGDSHPAARLDSAGERWFVKWNSAARFEQFEAELDALAILAVEGGPTLPTGIAVGRSATRAWLITEWLDFQPAGDARAFGRRLARMHRCSQPCFGWHEANFLGASRQDNHPSESWPDFWWSRRLEPQFERAGANGLKPVADLATIRDASDSLLGHDPRPALLHGDLWGGNHAYLPGGSPVIFDPAPYFGDRETDLAMMRLFGGFHPAVFEAYEAAWPLTPGSEKRLALYQLYPLLNHYNLFGAGWEARVMQSVGAVLRAAERA